MQEHFSGIDQKNETQALDMDKWTAVRNEATNVSLKFVPPFKYVRNRTSQRLGLKEMMTGKGKRNTSSRPEFFTESELIESMKQLCEYLIAAQEANSSVFDESDVEAGDLEFFQDWCANHSRGTNRTFTTIPRPIWIRTHVTRPRKNMFVQLNTIDLSRLQDEYKAQRAMLCQSMHASSFSLS